jgi:hypothetical protein
MFPAQRRDLPVLRAEELLDPSANTSSSGRLSPTRATFCWARATLFATKGTVTTWSTSSHVAAGRTMSASSAVGVFMPSFIILASFPCSCALTIASPVH